MKIALYIDDGREQIVLTPETDTERNILARMHDGTRKTSFHKGGFYACLGGWTRLNNETNSTIIVFDKEAKE